LVIAPHIAVNSGAKEAAIDQKVNQIAAVTAAVSEDISPLNGTMIFSKSHTWVGFSLKHMLSTAKGTITIDTGYVNLTGDMKTTSLDFVLNTSSINTNNTDRNEHLATADFFEVAKYPTAKFHSTSIDTASGNKQFRYVAKGDLTIKDVTKHIELPFNYIGETKIPNKPSVYTFEGEYSINRVDYHVGTENKMLGSEVKISYSIEASPKKK
jgi:polyisoprenoid-binding protein YceI